MTEFVRACALSDLPAEGAIGAGNVNGLVLTSTITRAKPDWKIAQSHRDGVASMALEKVAVPALILRFVARPRRDVAHLGRLAQSRRHPRLGAAEPAARGRSRRNDPRGGSHARGAAARGRPQLDPAGRRQPRPRPRR